MMADIRGSVLMFFMVLSVMFSLSVVLRFIGVAVRDNVCSLSPWPNHLFLGCGSKQQCRPMCIRKLLSAS